jgi:alpha-glucosidase
MSRFMERVPDGQWYLHLFAAQQPDLNWANREVREDFLGTLRFWSDRGVDGFRVDVAHGLAKNLSEPLQPVSFSGHLADWPFPHGTHPFWDRDEVDAGEFLRVITDNLAEAQQHGASVTWVLSNHDVVRHATRYALPFEDRHGAGTTRAWLLSNGTSLAPDLGLGLRRARAATLLMLALPGSAYLYQGEELGLHEVADIPPDRVRDPVFARSGGTEKGRDGCRVPLPWTADGPSFGFGGGTAHLPQPDWFGPLGVQEQQRDRPPPWPCTSRRSPCGTGCRRRKPSNGCRAAGRCCTSAAPAAGGRSPTSGPGPSRCPTEPCCWPARPSRAAC